MVLCEHIATRVALDILTIRKSVLLAVALPGILFLSPVQAEDRENGYFCFESYDKYRQIRYWARKNISIRDYSHRSGDADYLSLTYVPSVAKSKWEKQTNKEIVSHFEHEFEKFIRANLPFHDTSEGWNDRWDEAYKKYKDKDNFFEIFNAQEEARRNSLYGPEPGAVFCHIKIERRTFPVLYEMRCSVVANNRLINREFLTERMLGYSTSEHILGELKVSVTRQLEALGQKLQKIRSCEKR